MRWYRGFAVLVFAGVVAGFGSAANAAVLITVDKAAQQMSVSVDGEPRWTWPVSTGIARHDTPNGRYTAFRMEADHYSKEWDDAPMPHSIFFTMQGHAIHGSYHSRLGRPASHGCVRLAPENAAQLFALVKTQGLSNTKVVIDGDIPPPPTPPAVAQRPPAQDDGGRARAAVRPEPDSVGSLPPRERWQRQQRAARAYVAPPPEQSEPPAVNRSRVYDGGRAYAAPPPVHSEPPAPIRPRVYDRRRIPNMAGIYYDQRVEVIEETNINGTWVRRRYYRQARPQDFHGFR